LMVAILDRTKRPYFLLEGPGHGVMFTKDLGIFLKDEVEPCHVRNGVAVPQSPKYPWAVCPHVSDPESLMDYYSKAGFIMILLGKCLCQECHEQILTSRNLQGFLDSCQHMSNVELQQNFIDPLIRVNGNVSDARRPPWACCSHIAQKNLLERLYQCCKPIFIHAGQVACNECMDAVPLAGASLPEYTPMNDDLFQQRVVDQLYPLNLKMLQAIRKQNV
jgi:hypothetical protein